MLTILFWNVNQRDVTVHLAELAFEHHVDVVVLTENSVPQPEVAAVLEARVQRPFDFDPLAMGVELYTRFPLAEVRPELSEEGCSIRELPLRPQGLLLALLHFPSKLWKSDADQAALCPEYAQQIRLVEERRGHRRTLVVGDLNMNPYEPGVLGATGFHAVPSRRVAARGERLVDRKGYPLFYNPMWNCFGDERGGPTGTFFRDRGNPVEPFWHLFDQVLVRPELIPRFRHQDLRILSQAAALSLVDEQGRPCVSDHLSVVFRLDLQPPVHPS
jgi:endonuclease/exonuclease/phosphatase family protein